MSWYRTLLGVVAWIVILAPILPVSPIANLAGPPPSSLPTSRSSIARRLLNLESVLHPSSLGHRGFSFNAPPRPPYTIVLPSHGTKESASRPALIRHGVSHVMHRTQPPNLRNRSGSRTRQALRRMRLRWIAPVLDTIVRPSTTPTGKADVAPTLTRTTSNPAPPQVAPGLSRGRSYAYDFKSRSTSSAIPSIFDVGRYIRNWIASAGGRSLLGIEYLVGYADRGQQQVVLFSLDVFAGLTSLLSDATNWILAILKNLPRTPDELLSTWNSFIRSVTVLASQALSTAEVVVKDSPRWSAMYFSADRRFVVDNWPTSGQFLSAFNTLPSASYSLARRTVSDALATVGTPPSGYPSWPSACTWILKRFFVSFHLPALVIFWSAWALYTLIDRYGPSLEWSLLPSIGFDPRLVGRQIRRMMQPRHWNVEERVMFFLAQRARQADANRRRRYEPEPSESEGSEWEFEDDGPFITNGEPDFPFNVPAWTAEVEPAVDVKA